MVLVVVVVVIVVIVGVVMVTGILVQMRRVRREIVVLIAADCRCSRGGRVRQKIRGRRTHMIVDEI